MSNGTGISPLKTLMRSGMLVADEGLLSTRSWSLRREPMDQRNGLHAPSQLGELARSRPPQVMRTIPFLVVDE
ncbi:MAG TPA: hypothetical protein VKF14_21005 [Candidatus Dormibacteraeota bacterium]|nr:hypothetical protein [Candidatus Dormibacteraeota bacterium]